LVILRVDLTFIISRSRFVLVKRRLRALSCGKKRRVLDLLVGLGIDLVEERESCTKERKPCVLGFCGVTLLLGFVA
jgi:hypothetical protein